MFLAFTLRYPLAWGGNAGSRDERSATLSLGVRITGLRAWGGTTGVFKRGEFG